MDKNLALLRTHDRFTNLIDGKVLSKASVTDIIDYYESLLADQPKVPELPASGIMQNFIEDDIQDQLNEADYWDGDNAWSE